MYFKDLYLHNINTISVLLNGQFSIFCHIKKLLIDLEIYQFLKKYNSLMGAVP